MMQLFPVSFSRHSYTDYLPTPGHVFLNDSAELHGHPAANSSSRMTVFIDWNTYIFSLLVYIFLHRLGVIWWPGEAVACWSPSTKLTYVGPG